MRAFIGLVLLSILFTIALSAPVERASHARHHSSFRHGHPSLRHELSLQILAAIAKRPPNFTFTPVYFMEDFTRVEYGRLAHPEASDFRFSATLSKLGLDDEASDTGHSGEDDTQAIVRSHETHNSSHVMISISDSLMRTFEQKGLLQDTIPHYVRQNVHVTDSASGDQYQLVPNHSPEKSVPIDAHAVRITLKLD